MSLSRDDVIKIAHLARLAIAEEDIPKYAEELSKILNLVEQMNSVNTNGIEPMAHSFEAGQPLRADEVTETNQRELFQANSPQVEAGLFLVPKVID